MLQMKGLQGDQDHLIIILEGQEDHQKIILVHLASPHEDIKDFHHGVGTTVEKAHLLD